MEKKSFLEICNFMCDPSTSSLLCAYYNSYISLFKVPVGKAFYVYGEYGYSPNFNEDTKLQYSLVSIVADSTIYIKDLYFFGIYSLNERDRGSVGVMLEEYYKKLDEQLEERYQKWYETLPANTKLTQAKVDECINSARALLVKSGSANMHENDAPIRNATIASNEDAISLLTGSITCDEIFEKWTDKNRSYYENLKAVFKKTSELAETGVGLSEKEMELANAIRDLNVKFLAVEFEHDGVCDIGKVSLKSVQDVIVNGSFSASSEFSTYTEEERIRQKFMGNRWTNIPFSYISRVISRGKTVWERSK